MKKLLAILAITMFSICVEAKPLPIKPVLAWDIPITKVIIPDCEVYFCNTCGTPYGRIDITVDRGFPYTTCEYTTVNVLIYQSFTYGWPRHTYWGWIWTAFSVTIPANQQQGYVSYDLKSGEAVHADPNSDVISSDIQVDNLAYCY